MRPKQATILTFLSLVGSACGPAIPAATTIQMAPAPTHTQLIGEGRLAAAPEYIELTVRLQSECYDSPAAASAATDRATAQVRRILIGATDSKHEGDGVFSHGGVTRPFSRYEHNRRTCRGTFQKSADVVMKSSRVAEFPREFSRIQQAILVGTLRKPPAGSTEVGITFATIATPIPRLTHEKREQLERDALADAMANARDKYSAAAKLACAKSSFRVVRFVERSPSEGRPIAYDRSAPSAGTGPAVEFDAIWINKILVVDFELASKSCAPGR